MFNFRVVPHSEFQLLSGKTFVLLEAFRSFRTCTSWTVLCALGLSEDRRLSPVAPTSPYDNQGKLT